jgi:hypothetical protein
MAAGKWDQPNIFPDDGRSMGLEGMIEDLILETENNPARLGNFLTS